MLSAFGVKQSGFPSVSTWKLLVKNSNINCTHFVKKQQLGRKKRS